MAAPPSRLVISCPSAIRRSARRCTSPSGGWASPWSNATVVGFGSPGLKAGTRGRLRILSSATPADYLLPPLIGEFLQAWPDVRVVLRVATLAGVHDERLNGEYDVGIGPADPVPRGWRAEPLYDDEMTLFVPPTSALGQRAAVSWDEVRCHLLVGQFPEPYFSRYWAHLSIDSERLVELRTAEAIKRVVESSGGVGVLARSAVEQEIGEGRFVPVRVPDFSLRMPYALFVRPLTAGLPAVERFRALLLARLVQHL